MSDATAVPVQLGERIGRTIRYTREQISQFAHLTHDGNPLHHEVQAAHAAGFPDVIAAGQQTSSNMMGLVASHFSRREDGIAREMLCLNFNFSYKHPVYAGQDLHLLWTVRQIESNRKLGGLLVHLDGVASLDDRKVVVVGRGTILLRESGTSTLEVPQPLNGIAIDTIF